MFERLKKRRGKDGTGNGHGFLSKKTEIDEDLKAKLQELKEEANRESNRVEERNPWEDREDSCGCW